MCSNLFQNFGNNSLSLNGRHQNQMETGILLQFYNTYLQHIVSVLVNYSSAGSSSEAVTAFTVKASQQCNYDYNILSTLVSRLKIKKLFSFFKRKRNCETTLLVQATIICGVLEVETICFYLFPALSSSIPHIGIFLNVAQNCLVIFNNTIHPIVYFVFNHEVRRIVKRLICYRF